MEGLGIESMIYKIKVDGSCFTNYRFCNVVFGNLAVSSVVG